MPRAKIVHAMAFYFDKDDNQQIAWRGQVVDLSEKDYEHLDAIGALIPADSELPVHGKLTPLPNMASDEELIAWVSVATKAEIAAAIADHPALADRLQSAHDEIQKRLKAQDELLSGLKPTIAKGKAKAKTRAAKAAEKKAAADKAAGIVPPPEPEDEEEDEEEELDEDDPREVVKGTVDEVSKFLSEHPETAADILAAEQEAATNDDREVRKGIIDAVAAVTGHTQ